MVESKAHRQRESVKNADTGQTGRCAGSGRGSGSGSGGSGNQRPETGHFPYCDSKRNTHKYLERTCVTKELMTLSGLKLTTPGHPRWSVAVSAPPG